MCYPFSGNMLASQGGSYSSHFALWRAEHWGRHLKALKWPQLPILPTFRYQFKECMAPLPHCCFSCPLPNNTTSVQLLEGWWEDVTCKGCPLLSVLTVGTAAEVTHKLHVSPKYYRVQFWSHRAGIGLQTQEFSKWNWNWSLHREVRERPKKESSFTKQ